MTLHAIVAWLLANKIEIAGFVTTLLGIWLTTKRLLICWPVTLLADLLYLVVFYRPGFFPIPCCKSFLWPSRFMVGGTGGAA